MFLFFCFSVVNLLASAIHLWFLFLVARLLFSGDLPSFFVTLYFSPLVLHLWLIDLPFPDFRVVESFALSHHRPLSPHSHNLLSFTSLIDSSLKRTHTVFASRHTQNRSPPLLTFFFSLPVSRLLLSSHPGSSIWITSKTRTESTLVNNRRPAEHTSRSQASTEPDCPFTYLFCYSF